ncbi:MAG: M23 family metallopeptidase [Dysgonamonadaceae bacterium]|nr:M23 family metallopeptidase [Dysgonamonadaceae bacterium]
MKKYFAKLLIIGMLNIVTFTIFAQEIVSPLNIPLFLSGNFGELRNDHFHAGIDMKTQGVTGFPVRSVKDGYIARISVSPYGYGRAVYINHPDGTTSVYGHLERFASRIEEAVRDSQYLKESFSVNLNFSPDEFPLKQAETFAYSGNTGGSGGPHLHFEFRDTRTEKVIDALPYFRSFIKDNRPPDIRGVMLFPQAGRGVVEGSVVNLELPQTKTVTAWGSLGVGIKAYDRMDETTNIYGVKEIIFRLDGVEIFHSYMDGFFFEESRYINSFIDWNEWKTRRSFYMKSFIEPGNKLGIYRNSRFNGIFTISEERAYNCQYELIDDYGNATSFTFTIIGKKSDIPEAQKGGLTWYFDRNNSYSDKGIELELPMGSLYSDISTDVYTLSGDNVYSPVYVIGDRAPLHTYCPVTLDITNDSYQDPNKYGIVAVNGNQVSWIGGKYDNGKVSGRIRELGRYTVMVDEKPPSITPIRPAQWASSRRIAFRISDDLSGIETYRGTIDGKFALFEYDAKSNLLFCNFDSKRMSKSPREVQLTVIDGAGNTNVYSTFIR